MRRKLLLSIAAVALVSSSAFAGTLTSTNDQNVSKEWVLKNKLSNVDSNVTLGTTGFRYVPDQIPAGSLDNPTLNIDVTGVKAINVVNPANLGICVEGSDQNLSVLKFDHVDTANNKFVFKSIDAANTMGNSKTYFICNTETNTTDENFKFEYKLDPDVDTAKVQFVLYSGDSQLVRDTSNTYTVVNRVGQLCAKVSSPFAAKIDPATGFVGFGQSTTTADAGCTSTSSTTTTTTDTMTITYYDNKSSIGNAAYEVSNYAILANVTASNELPINTDDTKYTVSNGTAQDLVIDNNKVFKMAAKDLSFITDQTANNTTTLTLTLGVDGKTPLSETTFEAQIGFNLLNNTDSFTDGYSATESAGSWVFKGTKVEIPYVVASGDTQTAIRLTNGQSVNANVYWTCIDDQGNPVTNLQVPAATLPDGETYVPANGAAAWLAKDILNAARAVNPDFAQDGKMKCSPLVTATSGVNGVVIMTINGARDRVIPVTTSVQD